MRALSSPSDRGVLPLCHPPCFRRLPRSGSAGAVPIVTPLSPCGTSRGPLAMATLPGKTHGCRQCPPQPHCAPGRAAGCKPSPDPRDPPEPPQHRRLLLTTIGRGLAEPLCRAPGHQKPTERKQERGGCQGYLVAPRGGRSPGPGPSPPRGAGSGACRGAGGIRSSGQQHRAHDLLWQVPCSLEPAPSERW